MRTSSPKLVTMLSIILIALGACRSAQQTPGMIITLMVDGRERAITQSTSVTVGELIRQQEIELGELDEVNPPIYSQVVDGMRITVARVREETSCEEVEVPFQSRTIPNEALEEGQTRLAQPGVTGSEQVCYRVTVRDGVAQDPVPISRVSVAEPQDEIIYVGPSGELDPVAVDGTLAYLSSGNIWMIRGSSTSKQALTSTNDVDGRVLDLSDDGRSLIFTRTVDDSAGIFNQLWLLPDTAVSTEPVALMPDNVLAAQWVPGQANTISYSTGEVTDVAPGWRANNDLFVMTFDPQSGEPVTVEPLVPASSFGLYNWWGTRFEWSPSGEQLAWVRADSMGLVDLNSGSFQTLLTYPVFETRQSWSWRATVSFSPDEDLIATTVHGDPVGNEPPQTSPAFHVAVAAADGSFSADIAENTGIWSTPQYAPLAAADGQQYIAYLRARDLANSINQGAEYDLVIADRDGSNDRVVFPPAGQRGLNGTAGLTWNPAGMQLALVYQGNIWIVDAESGRANQLTLDGNASQPVWSR